MKCRLCRTENVIKIEEVSRYILTDLYKKIFNVDCKHLINQNISLFHCNDCDLRFYDPMTIGDEKFYNALQKFDWYYMDEKPEYAEVAKYIDPADVVLDVGSGKGAFAKNISSKNFIGLDLSKGAKKLAKERGVTVKNETIENYAKEHPKSVDVVTSFQVLEHVENPKSFLQAKIDVLRSGGKMIIAVPSEDSFLRHVTNGILNMPPHHVTRWSDKALRFIAEKYDLDLNVIHHEKMQNIHKEWFVDVFIQNIFLKTKLIDVSFTRKILAPLSRYLSYFLTRRVQEEFFPYGHTVIAIYEKK